MTKKKVQLSENHVKEILGIDNFRHLTKNGAIEFVSMMSEMDREVAIKALEQFPDLARTAVSWANDYKETMIRAIDVNAEESNHILTSFQVSLEQLNAQLNKDDLSTEDYKIIVDGVCRIQEMMLRLHEDNQRYSLKILQLGVKTLTVLGVVIIAGLGANGRIKIPSLKK